MIEDIIIATLYPPITPEIKNATSAPKIIIIKL